MENGFLNLACVRPWWIRLLFLAVFGSPLFCGGALHGKLHAEHFYQDLGSWTAYALFVWLFIAMCVGLKKLIDWLVLATIFALTVAFTGAAFRKLGVWTTIETFFGGKASNPIESSMDLVFRVVVVLTACPFALLSLRSFPASDVMRWVSRNAGRRPRWAVFGAIVLRMLQHVAEVVTTSMIAWREENPEMILPRYRADWRGSLLARLRFFDWVKTAVFAWSAAIAMRSLEVIPFVVRDFRRVLEATEGNGSS